MERLEQARQMLNQRMISVGKGLDALGAELYVTPDTYWSDTDKAAASLAENADVLRLLLRWLESESVNVESARIADLLTAAEALARVSTGAFAVVADPDVWEPILTEWVRVEEHWTARVAAVRLLGHLRRVTDRVVVALRAAMKDVSFVQQAAYESVAEFRRIEGDILSELLLLLGDPSAGVAAATARLLVGVARAEGTSSHSRRILRALEEAATRSCVIPRPVYLMEEAGGSMRIRFVDRLDRILHRAMFEISGL